MNDLDSQSAQALAFVAWPVKEPYDPAGQARHDAAAGDGWNLPAVHSIQATVALACPLFVPERPGAHATQWERDARDISLLPHRARCRRKRRRERINEYIWYQAPLKSVIKHRVREICMCVCNSILEYDRGAQTLTGHALQSVWVFAPGTGL